jgi:hypothetical protein
MENNANYSLTFLDSMYTSYLSSWLIHTIISGIEGAVKDINLWVVTNNEGGSAFRCFDLATEIRLKIYSLVLFTWSKNASDGCVGSSKNKPLAPGTTLGGMGINNWMSHVQTLKVSVQCGPSALLLRAFGPPATSTFGLRASHYCCNIFP